MVSASPPPAVRRATLRDAAAIGAVLAEALAEDAFVRWVVGRPSPARIRRYIDLVLRRLTLPYGEVYLAEPVLGAALWAPPGAWDLGLGEQLGHLPHVLRVVGLRRAGRVLRASERIESHRPSEPYFYLALVGTAERARGRGIGSALLAPVLAQCDAEGLPAALDTSERDNLGFYRRRGFEVTGRTELEDGPTVWSMVRPPSEP